MSLSEMGPSWQVISHQGNRDLTEWILNKQGCHLADNIFSYIFLKEIITIFIKISLNFILWGYSEKKIIIGLVNGLAPIRYLNRWLWNSMIHDGYLGVCSS